MKQIQIAEDFVPLADFKAHRFLEGVREGLADAEAGRLIDAEDLGSELDAEFGPLP